MNQDFDIFGNPELPYIILSNPNGEPLYSLGLAYETKMVIRFNAINEFSFLFPESIDGGVTTLDAFSYLQNKRIVAVEGYGEFQITDAEKDMDGSVSVMSVKCESREVELIQKKVSAYSGTKPLYNILSPDGTVLQDMLDLAPNWSVGDIDTELLTLYRTFDISDSNVYNVLMENVSKAFECIFIFDTVNKTISAKIADNATTETDIFVSFNNLIENANFSEKSDEITTSLSVFGRGNLNINLVNPMGTSKIYNFDYYKSTDWMTQGLIDALDAWEAIISSEQSGYASNLLMLEEYNQDLLGLQSDLATLTEEYMVLEGLQTVSIQAGEDYSDINTQLSDKQDEIDAQNVLITNKQNQIDSITSNLQTTNTNVSFTTNFTSGQLLELNNFIFENTYRNENIIQTDSMTLVEIQQQAQALYDQAINVLERVSQPRYEFSVDLVNYIVLPQFSVFTSQTDLGSIVTVEVDEESYIQTVLLEMEMQFDDPSNFSITFSNRLRLDNENYTFSDLIGEVVKTGSSVAFDSTKWANWENNYKDNVSTFITSALDATANNIISNTNQEILINQHGLRARESDGAGGYEGKQAWLVNNVLAFSDDGFQTAKLALGEINLPEGGTAYGLVGDVIVGRLLAGNTLTIENEGNNFVLDSTGATLNNAKFSIETTNTKIIIDPTETISFRIQKNEGGTFTDKFWVDNSGNVNFAGNLSGATGTFSGTLSATVGNIGSLVIDSQGLKTSNGQNYLRGDGSLKWGGLNISGSSATFTGAVHATTLTGTLDWSNLTNVPANNINYGGSYGTLSGNAIYGGTASLGGVNVTGSQLQIGGNAQIIGALVIANNFTSNNGILFMGGGGTNYLQGSLSLSGSFYLPSGTGNNGTYSITTPYGTRYFTFSRGVLVNYSS